MHSARCWSARSGALVATLSCVLLPRYHSRESNNSKYRGNKIINTRKKTIHSSKPAHTPHSSSPRRSHTTHPQPQTKRFRQRSSAFYARSNVRANLVSIVFTNLRHQTSSLNGRRRICAAALRSTVCLTIRWPGSFHTWAIDTSVRAKCASAHQTRQIIPTTALRILSLSLSLSPSLSLSLSLSDVRTRSCRSGGA